MNNSPNITNDRFTIFWDAHGCPPFKIGSELSFLKNYTNAGVNFVSLNMAFDINNQNETLALIRYYRDAIQQRTDFIVIENVQQITHSRDNNKLAIAFDIEGCNVLNGKLEMLKTFHELGVRQIAPVYNKNNSYGGGCFDQDTGLTSLGKDLIKECNKMGIVLDCSHAGFKTSMQIMDLSESPVVFSHSNPKKLADHPRNITDEQIIACKNVNGVIGINGVNIFLGSKNAKSEKIVEHIDYIVQKIGPEHVGIGFDSVFDKDEINSFIKNNPNIFPKQHGFNDVTVAEPKQFQEIKELLLNRGYNRQSVNNILGGNFFRVARSIWK